MPTTKNQNRAKLDKIPSEQRFIKSKDRIVECWKVYQEINPVRFHNELRVSLIGKESKNNWEKKAFDALIERSKYLVFSRKLKVWN